MIEIKGEGCAVFGDRVLGRFLRELVNICGPNQFHGVRVDVAWDHVQFGPAEFYGWCSSGNFNSKSFTVEDREWRENIEGQTAYLGRSNRKKSRLVRVYNKRGFNRLEQESRERWAEYLVARLAQADVDQWSEIAMEHLRGMVDFVNRSVDPQPSRCPLLQPWAEFIGNAGRAWKLPAKKQLELMSAGRADAWVQRNAFMLDQLVQGLGWEWLRERAGYWLRQKQQKLSDADRSRSRSFVHELRTRVLGSGLVGTDSTAGVETEGVCSPFPSAGAIEDDIPF